MRILTHELKLYNVILEFISIFDMAIEICNSLIAFILPGLTKFQDKKTISRFKFDNLNLELVEATKIPKATAQRFCKSEIAAFWNNENSLHTFAIFLSDCPWFGLLLP